MIETAKGVLAAETIAHEAAGATQSAQAYTRAAFLTAILFAIGLALDNEIVFLAGACVGMTFVTLGLIIQSKEGEVFVKIASEQRVDFISGLPNERLFYERLNAEHSRTKRTGSAIRSRSSRSTTSTAFREDDKFNGIKLLARSLEDSIRNTDTIGRVATSIRSP